MKDFSQIIMNPARQRIAQYLILHQTGTVNEISAALSDIPRPSLYRHMKILLDAGCVEVAAENAVRGAVERTYQLVANPMGQPSQQQIALLIQNTLLSLAGSFAAYFDQPQADPQKDMLSVSTSTLLLSDEEMAVFFSKIAEAYKDIIGNEPRPDRKPRSITLVSAPAQNL